MRYGRNKTKMMVGLKIFFVWIVSITISSPIFIFGAKDTTTVYNDGLCVPTIANFVIYGSIFAFYIPLTIMLITYVLTIRILWKNQILMKNIERSNNYRPRNRYGDNRCVIRTLLSPPSDDGSRKVSLGNNSDTDATMLAGMLSQHDNLNSNLPSQDATDHWGQYDPLPTQDPEQDSDNNGQTQEFLNATFTGDTNRSASMSCLEIHACDLSDTDQIRPGSPNIVSFNRGTNVANTESVGYKRDRNTLQCAVSCNNVPNLNNGSSASPRRLSDTVHFHSCGNLTRDFKLSEWKQHYFQIQREMDQCLKDSNGSPKKDCLSLSPHKECSRCSPSKERSPRRLSASHGNLAEETEAENNYRVYSQSQITDGKSSNRKCRMYSTIRQPMYDSSADDLDSSSSSELLTINLNPTSFHMYRLSVPQDATVPLLQKCNGTAVGNGHCVSDESRRQSSDSPDHIYFKRHEPSKKSIKYLLKRFNKSQGVKQILSKKATSNEKKASKVLGIIFAVFVILWTPFFIVNILSVSCSSCMWALTPQMMSIFVWMGYVASLANPIIYTMFNTAFRRTFIRILKCHLCKRGRFRMDSLAISYAAASQLNSDRRNTMTVLLKDEAR